MLNFYEADWEGIRSELAEHLRMHYDWNVLKEMDLDLGLVWFYENLIQICEAHTPKRKEKEKTREKFHTVAGKYGNAYRNSIKS